MRKNLILLVILGAVCACSKSKNEGDPFARTVEQKKTDRLKAVDAEASEIQLTYEPGRREYQGMSTLFTPCAPDWTSRLENVRQKAAGLLRSLPPESNSRDAALDFYRGTAARVKSLSEITATLNDYCAAEDARVQKCLVGSKEGLKLVINQNVAGFYRVHPVIRPGPATTVRIFSYDGEESIRTTGTDDLVELHENPGRALVHHADFAELYLLNSCLAQAQLTSEIGKRIARTLAQSLVDGAKVCDELKAKPFGAHLLTAQAETNFCAQNTDVASGLQPGRAHPVTDSSVQYRLQLAHEDLYRVNLELVAPLAFVRTDLLGGSKDGKLYFQIRSVSRGDLYNDPKHFYLPEVMEAFAAPSQLDGRSDVYHLLFSLFDDKANPTAKQKRGFFLNLHDMRLEFAILTPSGTYRVKRAIDLADICNDVRGVYDFTTTKMSCDLKPSDFP